MAFKIYILQLIISILLLNVSEEHLFTIFTMIKATSIFHSSSTTKSDRQLQLTQCIHQSVYNPEPHPMLNPHVQFHDHISPLVFIAFRQRHFPLQQDLNRIAYLKWILQLAGNTY